MPTSDERRARIEQAWRAAWDDGDVAALDALLAPHYQRHGSDGEVSDREAFKASIVSTRESFPDLTTVIDGIVVEGDNAAIRWRSTGRQENAFLGVPATKKAVSVSGATFARFENDQIVEEYVTWDPRSLLSALGIISVGHDR